MKSVGVSKADGLYMLREFSLIIYEPMCLGGPKVEGGFGFINQKIFLACLVYARCFGRCYENIKKY